MNNSFGGGSTAAKVYIGIFIALSVLFVGCIGYEAYRGSEVYPGRRRSVSTYDELKTELAELDMVFPELEGLANEAASGAFTLYLDGTGRLAKPYGYDIDLGAFSEPCGYSFSGEYVETGSIAGLPNYSRTYRSISIFENEDETEERWTLGLSFQIGRNQYKLYGSCEKSLKSDRADELRETLDRIAQGMIDAAKT